MFNSSKKDNLRTRAFIYSFIHILCINDFEAKVCIFSIWELNFILNSYIFNNEFGSYPLSIDNFYY